MSFPEVLASETSTETACLQLNVTSDLDAFRGHFDDAPIIPGVVQLQWAIYFSGLYLREIPAHAIDQVEALKFQHVIQPDSVVTLAMEIKNGKLVFAFTSDAGRHSSGKIALL